MRRLSIILRSAATLLAILVVLEFCARLDDALSYGAPFWGTYNDQTLFLKDDLGPTGRPGARYQKWQLNSLGYRGPELQPGALRIVCFGASETFGLYEAEGEEYPRQLERALNLQHRAEKVQVVNVAYAGETVATAALRAPQIVSQVHPLYATIYPSLAAYIWLPWVPEQPKPGAPRATPEPLGQDHFELRIVSKIRPVLKQTLPPVIQRKLRQREIAIDSAKYPTMDRVPEENVARFKHDLLRLIDDLRDRGVQPVLITHATAFGERVSASDLDLLVSWRRFYPMLRESGFPDMEQRMNDCIRQVAAEQGLPLIDAARQIPPRPEYFADFSHFTTAGSQLMASILADGLDRIMGNPPPHDETFSTTRLP